MAEASTSYAMHDTGYTVVRQPVASICFPQFTTNPIAEVRDQLRQRVDIVPHMRHSYVPACGGT